MSPRWSHNGREIFYVFADSSFVVARVRTDPEFAVESREAFASTRGFFVTPLIQRYDAAPDDQRLLAIRSKSPDAPSGEFVLTNVFELLRAIAPN